MRIRIVGAALNCVDEALTAFQGIHTTRDVTAVAACLEYPGDTPVTRLNLALTCAGIIVAPFCTWCAVILFTVGASGIFVITGIAGEFAGIALVILAILQGVQAAARLILVHHVSGLTHEASGTSGCGGASRPGICNVHRARSGLAISALVTSLGMGIARVGVTTLAVAADLSRIPAHATGLVGRTTCIIRALN